MSPRRRGTFAFRLDVDSLICLEQGIPNLLRLGERHGVRFTFFVNMGRSFSWRHTIANVLRRKQDGRRAGPASTPVPYKLSAASKLGRGGTLRTVVFNPRLGRRYRAALDLLHREGHELGLHGGSNHPAWQYRLDELGDDGLERLFRPAFEEFRDRYGHPRGFASPGFRYNQAVLGLLDNEGFEYASDMAGEVPFRPGRRDGASRHTHFQVPVNVIGERRVPVIEQGLARGQRRDDQRALAGEVQGESPSLFGSDRKAPDLLHIASRNRVKAWHYVHHRNPRAVTPGSIMPAFEHLTDEEPDAIIAFLESLR